MPVQISSFSDTHLGIVLPSRPRVERSRRGNDFFESFELGLAPAVSGETDLVVHGGDLFCRSRTFAGSTESTSFAERNEPTGFLMLEVTGNGNGLPSTAGDFLWRLDPRSSVRIRPRQDRSPEDFPA
jgi:DNA repair exonuclease SbcCD nuclease subunit